MIDVKKLVTGFIIVAAIAACSGLVLSFMSHPSGAASKPAPAAVSISGSADTADAVPTTAFVNTGSLQGNAAEVLNDIDTSSTDAQAEDPNNLTNIFADSFVNGLNSANPDGLAINSDGTPDITAPDAQTIAQSIASDPAVQDLTIPDWDTEADSQLINTTSSASQSAIQQYGSSISSIFNQYFVSTDLESELSAQGTGDPSQLPYLDTQIQGALNATLAVPTPAPLSNLQQSLVRVMVYEKNLVALGEDSATDPMKATLVFQGEKDKYDAAVADLQTQMSKASSLGLSLNDTQKASVPFIAQIFGVQPAEAQWVVFDPQEFAQSLQDYLNNILLQILKNTLVSLIQKKVLTAIQGAGKTAPKFVTSFATQLVNSFQSAALNTINSQLGQAPAVQQQALRSLITSQYQAPNGNTALNTAAPNTTIDPGGNFTNFGDYLSEFNSGGNVWANAMAIQDSALANGGQNQSANQTKNIAQQGFNGDTTCDDGSDPDNGVHYECADDTIPAPDGTCDGDGTPAEVIPNAGLCADGSDPTTILPGQITSQESNTVIKSGVELITSANDIVGVVTALADSLINQLAQNAINYANTAVNGVLNTQSPGNTGITGIASSSLNNTGNNSPATQGPVQCLPAIQNTTISTSTGIAYVYLSAAGGRVDTTCVQNNACPTTENSDGTPIYNWVAPGSTQGGNGLIQLTGSTLTLTYTVPGTYTATVTASTDNSQSSCQITVQQ